VAEAPVGYLATVEVAGYRGQAGAIGLDVNGHLTSDGTVDFTTLGSPPVSSSRWRNSRVGVCFRNASYSGFAQVSLAQPITSTLLPLRAARVDRGPADPGAGKTIDLYFCRWLRNVSTISPIYQEQAYHLELSLSSIGNARPSTSTPRGGRAARQ